MPIVLVVSQTDLAPALGRTVLWRNDVERVFEPRAEGAFDVARRLLPALVVVDAAEAAALALIERLRATPETRRSSVAAVAQSLDLAAEEALHRAGANLVLVGEVDPTLWDARLDELITVPRRRDVRIPVKFDVWSRLDPNAAAVEGFGLNVSVRGLLLETDDPLDVGTRLDMAFTLPGQEVELRVVGQVVREAASDDKPRCGVEMLILRGEARRRVEDFVEAERAR